MASRSIDTIAPLRSNIDLSGHSEGDFGLEDLELSFVFDDVMLVEYVDLVGDGNEIIRNGIIVPTNTLTKAWRKAKVILVGPNVRYAKVGDIVLFPNSMGITVANLDISEHGRIHKGVFLNESRVFGICKPKQNNGSTKTNA